jgi:hypothetical protein
MLMMQMGKFEFYCGKVNNNPSIISRLSALENRASGWSAWYRAGGMVALSIMNTIVPTHSAPSEGVISLKLKVDRASITS